MTSCWYRLREHGVPIWCSNQIWLYYNDDCKIMALNPLENSPGLLNCLSGKSKIGTDSGVSLSYLIKLYRQLNVIYFLEHWLNFAPKTVIRFGWMWGVGGLTESHGSFPYIYAQLALELRSLSLSLSHLTAKAGIKLLGDYCYFPPLIWTQEMHRWGTWPTACTHNEDIMLMGGMSVSHGALLIYTKCHAKEGKLQCWVWQRESVLFAEIRLTPKQT